MSADVLRYAVMIHRSPHWVVLQYTPSLYVARDAALDLAAHGEVMQVIDTEDDNKVIWPTPSEL